jgi:hypothetical protein
MPKMPISLAARAAHCRNYGADLRRLADRTLGEFDRERLLRLADEFERLARSIETVRLAA